jgi:drug/metabolite transporter (DMT)-like permease
LRAHHIVGALLGLAGTVVLLAGRAEMGFSAAFVPGYCAAFVAAFVWAIYSVASRKFAAVPSDAVVGFCLVTALFGAVCHLLFEQTVWPDNAGEWFAVLALGAAPVGAAFYVWDIGMKRGDIRVLGAASYAAPVLSTFALVLAGYAEPRWSLWLAAALVAVGGLIAAKDLLTRSSA